MHQANYKGHRITMFKGKFEVLGQLFDTIEGASGFIDAVKV